MQYRGHSTVIVRYNNLDFIVPCNLLTQPKFWTMESKIYSSGAPCVAVNSFDTHQIFGKTPAQTARYAHLTINPGIRHRKFENRMQQSRMQDDHLSDSLTRWACRARCRNPGRTLHATLT